jgi:hypothetical protein
MFVHTYYYQKYDKRTLLNENNFYEIWVKIILIIFLNDLINTCIKWYSIRTTRKRIDFIINLLLLPFSIFVFSILIFWSMEIKTYRKIFFLSYICWFVLNYIKSNIIFSKFKYAADLVKLLDPIFIINILLIAITDPIENNNERPNAVTFYEIYFRYMEFHILMLACPLIYNDRNIDDDVNNKLYSTSAVIGKYDSFRFSIILIFFHYLFVIINGLAFSIK